MKRVGLLLLGIVLLGSCAGGEGSLVVAVGTTLEDSGFMEALVAEYESEFPDREVVVVGRSSPEVLALGAAGSADLLITHAPQQEAAFVADGLATRNERLFDGRFVLVAPPASTIDLHDMTVEEVLQGLFDRTLPFDFISRGDNSGTHQQELELWEDAGLEVHEADWYLEAGQGMGAVLQIASQKEAVALTELGSFLGAGELSLSEVRTAGAVLDNPYTAIVPVGAHSGAEDFLNWLLNNPALVKQLNGDLFGRPVYELVNKIDPASIGNCPVTLPTVPGMVPPDTFPEQPSPPGSSWYGTPDLWTVLPDDGVYQPRKSVWWSQGYLGSPWPELSVTWEQLDGEGLLREANATGGYTAEDGWFMIGGLDPSEAGCWQITGSFDGARLTYVVYLP